MQGFPNLVTMHRAAADCLGPRASIRFKRDGLFHDLSWSAYRRQADAAAAGLISLGIQPGDRVGILSENRVEWLVADISILTAGAADVPLHAPLTPPQAAYQLAHSGVKGLFVSGQTQLDKIATVRDELPALEWVVSFNPAHSSAFPDLMTWDGLLVRGRKQLQRLVDGLGVIERSLDHDSLATIIYTSGTTGRPKGVMLTHGNLVSNAEATFRCSESSSSDILLSWLPYSHIYARTCDHYATICAGSTVCLAESIDTLIVNLAEIQPTDLTSVPRFYEKVWSAVEMLPEAERRTRLQRIFGPRVRRLSSGGAPLPRHVADGFQAAGLPLLEGYGLTESSPVISFNRLGANRAGTVGTAVSGVDVKIAADGEVLTRGPHVMKGYWNDPEATARAVVDGWLHTGDVGTLDAEGYLAITDRKKDLIITSGGKNIAPSELERLLVSDPYIDQAVVHGDRRPFVSALIVPNLPLLTEKARELGAALDVDEHDLIRNEAVRSFLGERVKLLMNEVSNPERVKALLVLGRPFRVEDNEMTATQKVRRRHILKEFEHQFEELYTSGKPDLDFCAGP
jgi:long-chain acyl-CoA synthetase